jgi:thioredoxin reductase/pSer/pThr/pTyr-binding forkhead associated (FHA) protein/ferredoxin
LIVIEIKNGPRSGERIEVREESALIGRAPHVDVRIDDGSISLNHCRIRTADHGGTIEDLGSSNGTRLGRAEPEAVRGVAALGTDTWVWVASTLLRVQFVSDAQHRLSMLHVGKSDCEVVDRIVDEDATGRRVELRGRLVFTAGPHEGRRVFLGERPVVIGRSERNDVALYDPLVSPLHCQIVREGAGYALVAHPASRRLTLVNGEVLKARRKLDHGDVITIGTSIIDYVAPDIDVATADPFKTVALQAPRFAFFGDVRIQDVLSIGRDPNADLVLDDPTIERRHAEIYFSGTRFLARSIGSSAIFRRGRQLTDEALEDRDVIHLGGYHIQVHLSGFRCGISVSTPAVEFELPRFAADLESVSPYRTMYRTALAAEPPAPARSKKKALKWVAPWDVERSLRFPLAVISAAIAAVMLSGWALSGGGRTLVGRRPSPAHASPEFRERARSKLSVERDECSACHAPFRGSKSTQCVACHESHPLRPLHAADAAFGRGAACTRCHGEHARNPAPRALVDGSACAVCHRDRHARFFPLVPSEVKLRVTPSDGHPVDLRADLAFTWPERASKLHAVHAGIERRCLGCHTSQAGSDGKSAWRVCFHCHGPVAALDSDRCGECHREHGDAWEGRLAAMPPAPPPRAPLGTAMLALGALLVPLGLVFFARDRIRKGRQAREERARLEEESAKAASLANEGKPELRFNYGKCVPIGACVKACPFDVIEMVADPEREGKVLPKAVRFDDCKTCGSCVSACGVNALTLVPPGAPPVMVDLPDVDANYESNIRGLYVIGEAAGKPLVKNANNIGFHVVNHMISIGVAPGSAQRSGFEYEVLVVGSGPGGLAAGLTAAKKGLAHVVLERSEDFAATHRTAYPKRKEVFAQPSGVENVGPLPVRDALKEELLAEWAEEVARHRVEIRYRELIENIESSGEGFVVSTRTRTYKALRVVIAIGTRGAFRKLQVPGADLAKVEYTLVDAAAHDDRDCLVVGGGESALETALALAAANGGRNRVSVVYRGAEFMRAREASRKALFALASASEERVRIFLESNPIEIRDGSVVLEKKDGSRVELANQVVYCMLGADPPFQFLERIGVKIVKKPESWDPGRTDVLVRQLSAPG